MLVTTRTIGRTREKKMPSPIVERSRSDSMAPRRAIRRVARKPPGGVQSVRSANAAMAILLGFDGGGIGVFERTTLVGDGHHGGAGGNQTGDRPRIGHLGI